MNRCFKLNKNKGKLSIDILLKIANVNLADVNGGLEKFLVIKDFKFVGKICGF